MKGILTESICDQSNGRADDKRYYVTEGTGPARTVPLDIKSRPWPVSEAKHGRGQSRLLA
jgi:hypothetical protein